MSANNERNKIVGGFAWKFAERISSQGVSFVLSVILARLLLPEEYGLVAMINILIVFANVFVTSGFTASLIQNKDADNLDFSTIFYCTLAMSLLMYLVIFFVAPYIADFFNMPELCLLTRIYAISLVITSYQTIQQAYTSRHMMFKKTFIATLVGTIISGIIGVLMAYNGYGVWALVVNYITNILLNMLTLMRMVPWKPQLIFSYERAKKLMNYGSKIMLGDLVNTFVNEIRQILIGKFYTPVDLAMYNRGNQLPNLITTNIESTLSSVLFPAMSNNSDQPEKVKQITRRSIKTSTYIVFFFMTLLAVASEPIIKILLTEKWVECVPYMQIICISRAIGLVSRFNIQAIKAIGKSDEILRMEVFKKPIMLLLVFLSVKVSVYAVAITMPIYAIYALLVNAKPSKKHLNYEYIEQLHDLAPAILLSIVVTICTFPLVYLNINEWLMMSIQIIVSFVVYIGLSIVFKIESFYYIRDFVTSYINKK